MARSRPDITLHYKSCPHPCSLHDLCTICIARTHAEQLREAIRGTGPFFCLDFLLLYVTKEKMKTTHSHVLFVFLPAPCSSTCNPRLVLSSDWFVLVDSGTSAIEMCVINTADNGFNDFDFTHRKKVHGTTIFLHKIKIVDLACTYEFATFTECRNIYIFK
jgi:hypothetical protein